jgi:hypothetical protein
LKKKVLIITEVFDPENFLINDVVSYWKSKNYDFEVLTRNPSYPNGKILLGFKNRLYHKSRESNIIIHRFLFIPGYQNHIILKLFNYLNYVIFSFFILLWIGRRFDRVFIYQTGPLSNALTPTLLKFIFKWRIIIWTQDLWPETVYAYGIPKKKPIEILLDSVVKFIYKKSDVILVSCKGFIPRIRKYIKGSYCEWIPNWNLVNSDNKVDYKFNEGFNFTFAGNIGKVQNLENVITAFTDVTRFKKNVYFNIFGDGSNLKLLKKLAEDLNADNVIFHGRKNVDEMPGIFRNSDVLLLSLVNAPIYRIMIPSKFQAYLNAKKPIFSIVSGELNQLVNEYNLGYTAEPDDINGMSKVFLKFIHSNKAELGSIEKNAAFLETEYFDRDKLLEKITDYVWE